MDVQVRLALKGGHVWEFCCDEDDPVVYNLVSALPGADTGGALPQDGLIQVEAKSGERLFLARSSLVSVEIIPIEDDLAFLGVRRMTASSIRFPGRMATPSPFVLVPDAMSSEGRRKLIEHALAQEDDATFPQDGAWRGARELCLGALEQILAKAIDFHLAKSRALLEISDPIEAHLHCRLLAVGDGGAVTMDMNGNDILCFVYHLHGRPKPFTGGGIRLFDGVHEHGARRATGSFRDVDIDDNGLLIFPGQVVNAGLPVRGATPSFTDGLFVVCGALRRGLPRT